MFAAKSSRAKTKPHQFKNAGIQPKLKIGQPDDKYEREADQVADAVMRMPDLETQMQSSLEEEEEQLQMQPKQSIQIQKKQQVPELQRMCPRCRERALQGKPLDCPECEKKLQMSPAIQKQGDGDTYASPEISNQLQASKGHGAPLSYRVQQEMAHTMGSDFSGVNIHTDSKAVQMNRQLGAKAFTHGSDIYFNRGQYDPGSSRGKHLLAHELTHVFQQTNGELVQREEENENTISKENDPCDYEDSNQTDREIHLNLGIRAIRVYERNGDSFRVALEFRDVIVGPATRDLARAQSDSPSPWCHLYPIIGHQEYTSHGLINFVNYCGGFGFHSNYWRKKRNGERRIERIPGDESAGCARIIDPSDDIDDNSDAPEFTESRRFYEVVQDGDCVRLYSHSGSWREPTFSTCQPDANCDVG
jgi:hypothetical protein